MERRKCPNPVCRIYDLEEGEWKDFKSLRVVLREDEQVEFLHYTNHGSKSEEELKFAITYDFVAYYSRYIPSKLQVDDNKKMSTSKKILNKIFVDDANAQDFKCLIIFEDLKSRYDYEYTKDQYLLLGFDLKNHIYDENNIELKFIRDMIAELHFKLKYSRGGLTYQVSERVLKIIYKSMKYTLSYITEMCNIPKELHCHEKLHELLKRYWDPTFKEFFYSILNCEKFQKELTSIVYKTFLIVGLFPAAVELNSMNESKVILAVKNFLANVVSAPYGSNHHASFSLGNFRYSFVNDPGSKDNQRLSKVNIGLELGRGFSIKTQPFKYFRLKFCDFFPMDRWITIVAEKVAQLIPSYLELASCMLPEVIEDEGSFTQLMWDFTQKQCNLFPENQIHRKIAKEFYERYSPELDKKNRDSTKEEKNREHVFKRLTQIISDAEIRGYDNLSNNCQTIVSELVCLICKQFQSYVEPLHDPQQIMTESQFSKQKNDLKKEFLKFGSQFNYNFTGIGPFSLTYMLSYFDSFTDKDTSELFCPSNFENIQKHIANYLERQEVKDFIAKLEESYLMYSKIHVAKNDNKPDDTLPDIRFDLDAQSGITSCLLNLKYNEIFNIKREIKIIYRYKDRLEELERKMSAINRLEEQLKAKELEQLNNSGSKERLPQLKKEISEIKKKIDLKEKSALMEEINQCKEQLAKLPKLYEEKYPALDLYKELCFYYYNSVRLGIRSKPGDKLSYLGFLLVKKPDWDSNMA